MQDTCNCMAMHGVLMKLLQCKGAHVFGLELVELQRMASGNALEQETMMLANVACHHRVFALAAMVCKGISK